MIRLLVYNFLKFISPSMSRLWFLFLALLLIGLATLFRCFLKFALKECTLFTLGWQKLLLCEKLFGDIRELWSHDSNNTFSDALPEGGVNLGSAQTPRFIRNVRKPTRYIDSSRSEEVSSDGSTDEEWTCQEHLNEDSCRLCCLWHLWTLVSQKVC